MVKLVVTVSVKIRVTSVLVIVWRPTNYTRSRNWSI